MELLTFIRELGSASLSFFWLPVALWTIMGLIAVAVMKYSENAHSLFQYHGRIALLCALPLGLITSTVNHWINSYTEATQFATKFIVIQAPITVTATSDETSSLPWLDVEFLGGLLLVLISIISIILLLKLTIDFVSLNRFAKNLAGRPLDELPNIFENNLQISDSLGLPVSIAFSPDVEIPFTFGWKRPSIVLPRELKQSNDEKLNMAIRHELIHIKHKDYALNTVVMTVKALFWFHPLTHTLYNGFKEYREISCDSELLADTSISKKNYAELLFELASKKSLKNSPAVSMAVNSSNLKKRIQIMTTQTNQPDMFKTSLLTVVISVLFMTGIMACSDIQDSGITNKDIKKVQSEMAENNLETEPLYVLDGKIVKNDDIKDIISRTKPKYIEKINVLKGEKAIQKYGDEGKNGVVEIQIIDKEKALSDLLPAAPERPTDSYNAEEDFYVVVEQMPELKGGMRALQECASYPEEAKNAGIEGRVIIQFIVSENGQVENPQVIRGIGGGADEEALRCVKQAKFKPGTQNGEQVRVQYSLPMIFKMQNNTE